MCHPWARVCWDELGNMSSTFLSIKRKHPLPTHNNFYDFSRHTSKPQSPIPDIRVFVYYFLNKILIFNSCVLCAEKEEESFVFLWILLRTLSMCLNLLQWELKNVKMRMRADWERNFKMLIDSPSKVWEVKICVWIGRSTAVVTSEAAAIILSPARSL